MKYLKILLLLFVIAVIASRLLFGIYLPDARPGLIPESVSGAIQIATPYFAPPALFLLAMVLLYSGANLLFKDLPKLRHWQRIAATITHRNWQGKFTYSYTFNHVQFDEQGKDSDNAPKAGKTIRIYVNPLSPSESDTLTPFMAFFTGVLFLIGGVAATLGTVSALVSLPM